MTVGAAASSILVIAYFGGEWGLSVVVLGPLVLGILLVAFGLTQSLLLDVKWQVVRFFLNALFVVGVSLILIGEDVLGRSLLVDSYVLVLALLWLYIRIRSSQLSHQTICTRCNLICPLDETSS
jgi:formate/nitrite transporter FocA (FNT family)